eukprot:1154328-Pelagomonas_calceolata.AAC.1
MFATGYPVQYIGLHVYPSLNGFACTCNRELWYRASLAWQRILAEPADADRLLVVAHNNTNQGLLCTALGLPATYFRTHGVRHSRVFLAFTNKSLVCKVHLDPCQRAVLEAPSGRALVASMLLYIGNAAFEKEGCMDGLGLCYLNVFQGISFEVALLALMALIRASFIQGAELSAVTALLHSRLTQSNAAASVLSITPSTQPQGTPTVRAWCLPTPVLDADSSGYRKFVCLNCYEAVPVQRQQLKRRSCCSCSKRVGSWETNLRLEEWKPHSFAHQWHALIVTIMLATFQATLECLNRSTTNNPFKKGEKVLGRITLLVPSNNVDKDSVCAAFMAMTK